MIRDGLLFWLGSIVLVPAANSGYADDAKKAGGAFVIAIRVQPGRAPGYGFTVARDGSWEFRPVNGTAKQGQLTADDLNQWLRAVEKGGFDKLISNPKLGRACEPYMDIAIRAKNRTVKKRAPLLEKLAQAIHKKILDLSSPG
jgi:hypothetical protein